MFNAVFKIPLQFFILLLGVLIFVFYQFERPPVYFNKAAWSSESARVAPGRLAALEGAFARAHAEERGRLEAWIKARHAGDPAAESSARAASLAAYGRVAAVRAETKSVLDAANPGAKANDADYVFITFILDHVPHGLIGLLVTAFFCAALSSKAGELNALGSTTTVDVYRHLLKRGASDAHYVVASKCFTAFWGLVAIGFALFANLTENLIQAVNILGSVFYGVVLGLFLAAFFLKRVGGTAVFWSALAAQALVFALYFNLSISYLWYNVIGCAACMAFSLLLQAAIDLGRGSRQTA
jgi:Na+(H+)/acetate symporter ActP